MLALSAQLALRYPPEYEGRRVRQSRVRDRRNESAGAQIPTYAAALRRPRHHEMSARPNGQVSTTRVLVSTHEIANSPTESSGECTRPNPASVTPAYRLGYSLVIEHRLLPGPDSQGATFQGYYGHGYEPCSLRCRELLRSHDCSILQRLG